MSRYLLVKLDEQWSSHEYKPDFWERTKKGGFVWTIEHIMPQTLNNDWKIMLGHDAEIIYKENKHRIGNLTLSAYNSKLSNRSFNDKKVLDEMTIDGTKIKIGYKNKLALNSELKFGDDKKSLSDIPVWTETEIAARGQKMIDELLKLLKY